MWGHNQLDLTLLLPAVALSAPNSKHINCFTFSVLIVDHTLKGHGHNVSAYLCESVNLVGVVKSYMYIVHGAT